MNRIIVGLLLVALAIAAVAASDGQVQAGRLFADQGSLFFQPTEPDPGDTVTFRLWSAPGDLSAAAVYLRLRGDPAIPAPIPMTLASSGNVDVWETSAVVGSETLEYWYGAQDGPSIVYLNAFSTWPTPQSALNFWIVPGFHPPAWAQGVAWYQIFPDRFQDGDPANNVSSGEYSYQGHPVVAMNWHDLPLAWWDFFGGDLAGIRLRLEDYLQSRLGVEAFYLNPIFRSPSNHKYDVMDYREVDPHFGDNGSLDQLIGAAHNDIDFQGDYPVRVMLDGVFNYCGDWHYWFDRPGLWPTLGAFENPDSPWFDYFTFNEWPFDYVTFGISFGGHFDTSPKLDYANADLRRDIYEAPDSVAATWLKPPHEIDGWRLDVGQEVGYGGTMNGNHEIWAAFRQAVKTVNPDAIILGEFWEVAYSWLMGDQWDSVQNYNGFTTPLSLWLLQRDLWGGQASIDTNLLREWLQGTLADNPWPVRQTVMNALCTHDIPRFNDVSKAGGDRDLLKAGAVFLMTYPGAPCLYYGDEIGLEGGRDPDCRRPFPWAELEHPDRAWLLDTYQRLLDLRKRTPALRQGSFAILQADEASGSFAFARFDAADAVITLVRRRGSPAAMLAIPVQVLGWPDGTTFRDFFSGAVLTVSGGQLDLGLVESEFSTVLVLDRRSGSSLPLAVQPGRQQVWRLASPDGQLHAGWARIALDPPAQTDQLVAALRFRYDSVEIPTTETILFPARRSSHFQVLINLQRGLLDSGLALTNPGDQAAEASLRLTTGTGRVYTAHLTVAPGQCLPRFTGDLFPELPDAADGILEVTTTRPLAPMQLSVRTNPRGEFLLSALPVTALDLPPAETDVVLNYLAVGGGYTAEILFTAIPGGGELHGTVCFFGESGQPLDLLSEVD